MKEKSIGFFTLISVLCGSGLLAQAPPVAPPSGQKPLAATMSVYAFPTQGQNAEQQSKDEAECYSFATQNTGTDPFQLSQNAQKQQEQAAQNVQATKQATEGAGAKAYSLD